MRQHPKRRRAEKSPKTEISPVLKVHEIPVGHIKKPGIRRPANPDTDRFLLETHPAGKQPFEMKVMIPLDIEEPYSSKQQPIEECQELPVLFLEKNRIAYQEIENVSREDHRIPRTGRFGQGDKKGPVKGGVRSGQMKVGINPDPGESFHQAF
jgi:hypothetical protein